MQKEGHDNIINNLYTNEIVAFNTGLTYYLILLREYNFAPNAPLSAIE
jgi:hypothetical protein